MFRSEISLELTTWIRTNHSTGARSENLCWELPFAWRSDGYHGAIGPCMGAFIGPITAFVCADIMNCGSNWSFGKIVLRMYRAGEVNESEAPIPYCIVSTWRQDYLGPES